MSRTESILLASILLLALGLRLVVAAQQDPLRPYDRTAGGDEWWYLEYGYRQVKDEAMEPLSSAPLYLLLVGGVRYTLQPERTEKADKHMIPAPPGGGLSVKSVAGAPSPQTVRIIQVLQALMSTATVYFVFRMGWALADDPRVGLIAAGVMATSLAMIISAADIITETLFLFFLTAAMAVYVRQATASHAYRYPMLVSALVGWLFGLATMTRAVVLLLPVGIAIHMVLVIVANRRAGRSSGVVWRGVVALLAVYIGVNSIWTSYYYLRWGEVVIGAKGLSAFFYLGAQGGWQGPEETDNALGVTRANPGSDDDFNAQVTELVRADPLAYARTRTANLLTAYAQPYGTVSFPGESVKALVGGWWREDRTLRGLGRVVQAEAFAPKLLIYLVHYGGIVLGLLGVIVTRHRWRAGLVVTGVIAYITLVHLVLLALPRYLFPTLPFWWVLGGAAVVWWWDRRLRAGTQPN